MGASFPMLTRRAAAQVKEMVKTKGWSVDSAYLRALLEDGVHQLELVNAIDPARDRTKSFHGVQVVVAEEVLPSFHGYVIDYRSMGSSVGFVLKDPESLHSEASHPGGVVLSEAKLRRFHPELFPRTGFWANLFGAGDRSGWEEVCESVAYHLKTGDGRAAVVISVQPLIVAAYTDELDCVALLQFAQQFVVEHKLAIGSRLLTINLYEFPGDTPPHDLVLGPKATGRYINFEPIIADFLSDDTSRIETRKSQIREEEWNRAMDMGLSRLAAGVARRDGRPLHCMKPANTAKGGG